MLAKVQIRNHMENVVNPAFGSLSLFIPYAYNPAAITNQKKVIA
jgi:hypothetical protein